MTASATRERPREPAYVEMLASRGIDRYHADWSDRRDHFRRLISEFVGTFGLAFVLSFGAAILVGFGRPALSPYAVGMTVAAATSLWLVASIYAFGDVSAHFNPAISFAFALRGDMSWRRAALYAAVQLAAAACASLLARGWFGVASGLGVQLPAPGAELGAFALEALMTGGFVLVVLAIAQGPKLSGSFTPLVVGAYIMALGSVGALYDGSAINPARAFGPEVATGHLNVLWIYFGGDLAGAAVAVALDAALRGRSDAAEANAAEPANDAARSATS